MIEIQSSNIRRKIMINMERGAIQFRRIMEDSKKRSDAISMKYTESPEDLMRKRKSGDLAMENPKKYLLLWKLAQSAKIRRELKD